jgi:hypothetical protein
MSWLRLRCGEDREEERRAMSAAEPPVCRAIGCDGIAFTEGYCMRCWEELSAVPTRARDTLSDLGARLLDDPVYIRGFIWFLIGCAAGLIVTQIGIRLGWW